LTKAFDQHDHTSVKFVHYATMFIRYHINNHAYLEHPL
jgi:hypothetical protein